MAFVSITFLIFISAVFLLYFIVPKDWRWTVLLVSSYAFYIMSSKWLVLLMFATTLITFLTGMGVGNIYRKRDREIEQRLEEAGFDKDSLEGPAKKKAKGIMLLGLFAVLGILVFMKYYGFLSKIVESITGLNAPSLELILPLGISFYSLQAMAYILDVYREKIEADRSLPKFMLFMSFFPQIVQGPIQRHKQLAAQLYEGHDFNYDRLCKGAQLILWGFMKKLIIADRLSIPVEKIFDNYYHYQGMMILLGGVLYGLQVYADFSGGMDIARGVSQVLGIDLELNFNQPYFSTSVEDFWRRWHITLGAWMRDYIFYPLSLSKLFVTIGKKSRKIYGNKIGKKIPPFIAMFIVYFLVGIWHGSSWKYVAYGVYNGIFIVMGILLNEQYAKAKDILKIKDSDTYWRIFQMLRTFIIISIGRIISRAYRFKVSLVMLKSMTRRWYSPFFLVDGSLTKLGLNTANWIVVVIAIICLLMVDVYHERGISIRAWISQQRTAVRWGIYYLAIILVLIFGVYGPAFNGGGFIYEQF